MDEASSLEEQGKLREARALYRSAAEKLRAAGQQEALATALSAAGRLGVSLGDYRGAISESEDAVKIREALGGRANLAGDFNTLGLANQYLGEYATAAKDFRIAAEMDRASGDLAGEVTRLNNLGGVYFYQGYYASALKSYEAALEKVNAAASEDWHPWGRQLTLGNIANLDQRLGSDEKALEIYRQLASEPQSMPGKEYGQLLLNEGVLYRRLGDPVKALEMYRKAQDSFRVDQYSDGEIRAQRNIGIVRTMDFDDLVGAREAFQQGLALAERSANNRGAVQAELYLGEVQRRLGEEEKASVYFQTALSKAQKTGLMEEQWKALYGLGRIAAKRGQRQEAGADFEKAIGIVETLRTGLGTPSLKADFLADKRDLYDSLIALELSEAAPSVSRIFSLMERSRARALADRRATQSAASRGEEISLVEVQRRLEANTVFVEFWTGDGAAASVWATASQFGLVRLDGNAIAQNKTTEFLESLEAGSGQWKARSRELGAALLRGIPLQTHVILAIDSPLNIPFEALTVPGSSELLIEKSDICYLPAARFLSSRNHGLRFPAFPWKRQLVAFGDPPVSTGDSLAERQNWQALPSSREEALNIAQELPGRAEVHFGADARKSYLVSGAARGAPLLHLSTHTWVDPENPDRSRILMASDAGTADYVFQQEVYDLPLKDVGLITLSACDTARGKSVRGEGIQAFSQSFLAAGAGATVTTLWKVEDTPTAAFMQQFYSALSKSRSKSEALREAKVQFLRSRSAMSEPRYWAGFVLNGDGWNATAPFVGWSLLLFVGAVACLLASLLAWQVARIRVERRAARREPQSPQPHRP